MSVGAGAAGGGSAQDAVGGVAPGRGLSGVAAAGVFAAAVGGVAGGADAAGAAAKAVEWAPCSDRSRERGDPLAATASRGLQWFLVEVEGPWGANAFVASALGRELGQAIVHRVEAAGMRPLAIRRVARASHPAGSTAGAAARRREPQTRWRWAFVDSRPGFEEVRWGEVGDPRELLEVALDGSTGIRSPEPIFCVCTHAKHDKCCAVHGRPVALALDAEYPAQTWECSHLGGDRFAGTMVVFPEGLYFGRADDAETTRIVRDYADGRVDERFFRGRSSLSHPVQAAQHYAREHFGDDRLASFTPLAETAVADARPGTFAVTLAAPGSAAPSPAASHPRSDPLAASVPGSAAVVRVVVAETLSEPLLSTCAATRFGRVREFELVSLDLQPS
ncbi:sucrase ferredoxin [Subtercola sp. YIM 133946]|uniref:sucrase ferredoxin n=1 Tax=Subtercola sp. YIM 133946 TaxID=3118909 RepID=UPI002F91E0CD